MPTRDTPWPTGTPCWVDYGATDLDAAKGFYAELLGWEYTGGEPEFGGYLNATKGGRQVAGLGPQMDETGQPGWTTYLATDDADATVARIREAGGQIAVEPMEIGPWGRMVVAVDPQGHVFGLWESGEHTGVQLYNEPGSLAWNEAMVDDPAAARSFYGAVFGYRFDELPPEMGGAEGMDYTTFGTGGNPLGGLGAAQPGVPKGWLTAFAVEDTDRAVAAVEARGGKVTTPAEDSPYGRFAVVEDPWGAAFSVMGPNAG